MSLVEALLQMTVLPEPLLRGPRQPALRSPSSRMPS